MLVSAFHVLTLSLPKRVFLLCILSTSLLLPALTHASSSGSESDVNNPNHTNNSAAPGISQTDSNSIIRHAFKAYSQLRQLQSDYDRRLNRIGELEIITSEACQPNTDNTELFKGMALAFGYQRIAATRLRHGVINPTTFHTDEATTISTTDLLNHLSPQQTLTLIESSVGDTVIPTAHKRYLGRLASTLLAYQPLFADVYANPDKRQKLLEHYHQLTKTNAQPLLHLSHLIELKVPMHNNACLLHSVVLNDMTVDGMDESFKHYSLALNPTVFFYHFWLERELDGSREHALLLLNQAVDALNCCTVALADELPTNATDTLEQAATTIPVQAFIPHSYTISEHTQERYEKSQHTLIPISEIATPQDCSDNTALWQFTNGLGIAFHYYYDVALPMLHKLQGNQQGRELSYAPSQFLANNPMLDSRRWRFLNTQQSEQLALGLLNNLTLSQQDRDALLQVVNKLLEYRDRHAAIYRNKALREQLYHMGSWNIQKQVDYQDPCFNSYSYVPDLRPQANHELDEFPYRDYNSIEPNYYLFSFWLRREAEGTAAQFDAMLRVAQRHLAAGGS